MAVKVFDTFDGVAGTDIAAHTPDTDVVGTGWTSGSTNNAELDGNGALNFPANNNQHLIDAGTVDQWIVVNHTAGGADNRVTFYLRSDGVLDTGATTSYAFNYRTGDSGNELNINKVVSGTSTLIASGAFANTSTTTYSQEPEINGSLIDWKIDGVSELSIDDASILTGSYSGVMHNLLTDGGTRFFDLQISDTAPAVGSQPIQIFMNHYKDQGIS